MPPPLTLALRAPSHPSRPNPQDPNDLPIENYLLELEEFMLEHLPGRSQITTTPMPRLPHKPAGRNARNSPSPRATPTSAASPAQAPSPRTGKRSTPRLHLEPVSSNWSGGPPSWRARAERRAETHLTPYESWLARADRILANARSQAQPRAGVARSRPVYDPYSPNHSYAGYR